MISFVSLDFPFHLLASLTSTMLLMWAAAFLYATLCLKLIYKNPTIDPSSSNHLPTWKNLPIVGCLFSLGNFPHETLAKVAYEKFQNKIFKIKAGCRTSVVFSDYEDIISIAKNFPDQLFGKPSSFTANHVSSGAHNDFVKRWKKRRAYTNAGLKYLEKSTVNQILMEEVDNLISFLHQSHSSSPRDIRYDVTYYVSKVLYRMSYGELDEETCEKLVEIIHLMPDYTTNMGSFSLFDMLPGLHKVFKARFQKFVNFNNIMQVFCDTEMAKKLQEGETDNANLLSFLKKKLEMLKESNSCKHESLQGVFYEGLVDIIRAGTESTSLLVQWFLVYATTFPHVQHKMRDEIEKVLQESEVDELAVENIVSLHYCNAVVAESLRFCSLNPFLKRELTGDIVTRDGVKISKGSSLLFNNFALNFSEKQWSEANSFKPERFLDAEGKFDKKVFAKLLAFGFGNRRCIGVHTGKSLAVLMAVRLVQKYNISSSSPLDLRPIDGIGLSPKPFKVTLEQLSQSNC